MANKVAPLSLALSWVDGFGKAQQLNPPVSVSCKYNALSEGTWDLAAITAPGAILTVPLGPIASLRGYLIQNNTDADIELKTNTAGARTIPPGGVSCEMSPQGSVAPTTPTTELKLTTETATTLAGSVAYVLFGDPT